MRDWSLGFLMLLAVDCGGRAASDEPPPFQGAPAGGGQGGAIPKSTQAGTLASYTQSGDGIVLYPNPGGFSNDAQRTHLSGGFQTNGCLSLAFDRQRNLYALCYQLKSSDPPGRILSFAPDAQGTDQPMRVISGDQTELGGYATNIALGPTGKIYVVQDAYCFVGNCSGMVSVFSADAEGNVAPERIIQGPHTGIDYSAALAVDANGLIYVGNAEGGPVLVFAADAVGDAAPIRLVGSSNELVDVTSLAVDAAGNLYVTEVGKTQGVLVYGPTAGEGDTADRVIAGSNTGLYNPFGVAVGASGEIFVSDHTAPPSYRAFAAGASGNVPPSIVGLKVAGFGIALAP